MQFWHCLEKDFDVLLETYNRNYSNLLELNSCSLLYNFNDFSIQSF